MKSLASFLAQLGDSSALSLKTIDEALEGFNILEIFGEISGGATTSTLVTLDPKNKEDFSTVKTKLDKIIAADESGSLELNAKTRRKVKRLAEVVGEVLAFNGKAKAPGSAGKAKASVSVGDSKKPAVAPSQKVAENAAAASEDPVEESPLVQDKNLTELISLVRESKTAADLETSLAPVKFGIGNTHSRRTLKRAIEQVLTREEVEGGMNAKIRRRITRVVKALSPGEYPSGPTPPSSSSAQQQQEQGEQSEGKEGRKKDRAKAKDSPFVVFVGQLPFSCREEDLLAFFREQGIQGELKVRFLTDARSGQFRGMGFVDLPGYEQLRQALELHHSVFQGRKINVERSNQIGKKDTQRREEIVQLNKQRQQAELARLFEETFKLAEQNGLFSARSLGQEFREKLMRYSPRYLAKAVEQLAALPKKERSLRRLDEIFMALVSAPGTSSSHRASSSQADQADQGDQEKDEEESEEEDEDEDTMDYEETEGVF